jgi:hypothetical protein
LRGVVLEELSSIDGLLTEDFIAEGPLDMLKKAGDWAKNKGKDFVAKVGKAIQAVMKKISAVFKKIVKMGKKMMGALMRFLGVEISNATGVPTEITL